MTSTEKPNRYARYIEEIQDDIQDIVQQFGCQPILFIGSGLAKRYFGGPSWDELLSKLADGCTSIEKSIGFYRQSFKTPMGIGEEFARLYQEWAWSSGQNEFPKDMFGDNADGQSYIKYKIAKYFSSITPDTVAALKDYGHAEEIEALRAVKPHAIITTNYDQMIEKLFPDHFPVIGQQILKGTNVAVGEIYKIHGCVTDHQGLVFTQSDYDIFAKKKKFLSAKLLTFFNEHPLIFIGYSATDPNIRAILSDIDEALPEKSGMIPNVYILQWNPDLTEESMPAREKVIPTEDDRSVRVKLIEASDFSWVFDAFAANPALNDVNPRVLRALVARSYALVRHDIPKMTVHADFKLLTDAVETNNSFASLFGIANISDYTATSALYPYSTTQLGKLVGGNGWHLANNLLDKIKAEKGIDLKSYDNKYHRAEKINTTVFHKYSHAAVDLLKAVKSGLEYDVEI